jgi:predicted transcriptional regulator
MKITKRLLKQIIEEEIQNEIFGFKKTKEVNANILPDISSSAVSDLITFKNRGMNYQNLEKTHKNISQLFDKSIEDLINIRHQLREKEKEQAMQKKQQEKPSYFDPTSPDWRDDVKKFKEQERELRIKINSTPDRIPEKPSRDFTMDKEYPSGIRPGMTERRK